MNAKGIKSGTSEASKTSSKYFQPDLIESKGDSPLVDFRDLKSNEYARHYKSESMPAGQI